MVRDKSRMSRKAALVLICASALALGGCSGVSKLNPFAEKDTVLQGERRPVFGPGSGFEGPRKLPPPNSDYVGATMPANQPVTPTTTQQQQQPEPPPAPATAN